MRARVTVIALAVLALSMTPAATGQASPPDGGSRLCTWGGTPVAPTGRVTVTPGATNTPSAGPLELYATGELTGGGPCTGTMTFRGVAEAGATCTATVFDGKVNGVPGIATFHGAGAAGLVHEFLYDHHGNTVGSDQPNVLTPANATDPDHPAFSNCNTPEGFTGGTFSASVELYASYGQRG